MVLSSLLELKKILPSLSIASGISPSIGILSIGFFIGIITLITVFCLLCFLLFKNKAYFYYAGYIILGSLFILTDPPYDLIRMPSLLGANASLIFACLSLYSVNQFALAFLSVKKEQVRFYRWITFSRWLFVASLCFCLIAAYFNLFGTYIQWMQWWFQIFLSTAWTIQIALVIDQITKKNKDAYIYLLAITPLYLLTSYWAFCRAGMLAPIVFSYHPLLLGFTFEVLVLSIGIIYQSYLTEKTKAVLELQLKQQKLNAAETQIQILEDERNRIAEDLHDDLGSNLASLKLQIEGMTTDIVNQTESKQFILSIISESSTRLSEITHNLMPPAFKNTPFPIILENYFNQLKRNHQIDFEFHILNYSPIFTKKLELILYRITLELSQNIIKHSQAKNASIQLLYNDDSLVILAEDNGVGMKHRHQGIGLESIEARVDYMNGTFNIDSNPHGTSITIVIPFIQNGHDG